MLKQWILMQLEAAKDQPLVIVRDPLGLTQGMANDLNAWGKANAFTVIPFATNLLFRWKYDLARADAAGAKLLLLDQTPARRRQVRSVQVASAPFYPDLLARTPPHAIIELDLRQFLRETTGDPDWPAEADDPLYARLITPNLDGILATHRNLRAAHPGRFTDYDFKVIIAFASLGIPDAAFKKLAPEHCWQIGLLRRDALESLDQVAPEAMRPIREELGKAPPPFCWFADRDPETVARAFYLAAILAQHTPQWRLLLANIDPSLAPLAGMDPRTVAEAAPKLVSLDAAQADRDLAEIEAGLDARTLQFLLLDQLHVDQPAAAAAVIEAERYSVLFRSLALLMALGDLISTVPATAEHARIATTLFGATAGENATRQAGFVEGRPAACWSVLREAYRLATELAGLGAELGNSLKSLKVTTDASLTFAFFHNVWNERRLNRIEFYFSALERQADSDQLLPRRESELPAAFANTAAAIRARIREWGGELRRGLNELNRRFQELVRRQYPDWAARDAGVRLTSQFIRRCLKPHWDPQTQKACLLIFDGMRYDIWDELLRPMLTDMMEVVADTPALSLLPSETHITRKAISAGAFPEAFDSRASENDLLAAALARDLGYTVPVEALVPEGLGTAETVRYRAGNLDVTIFELCDKELHKVQMRILPDGRELPSRPLAFIYQQHIKSILETEVMAALRRLSPGTVVFITADHGFGSVGRQPLWFDEEDLNEPEDCSYLNCRLAVPFDQARVPAKVRANVIPFRPEQLRMPFRETRTTASGGTVQKEYGAIVFPAIGYSFKRPGGRYHYNPDAYSHGGISLGELMIPMAVLRVKERADGLLALGLIAGPDETIEGEEAAFIVAVRRGRAGGDELRLDIEASYARDPERFPLPPQVIYAPSPPAAAEVVYRFRPDPEDATADERRAGAMRRTLTITATACDGRGTIRKSQSFDFEVRLNTDRVIRRVGNLGSILGLMPKGGGD